MSPILAAVAQLTSTPSVSSNIITTISLIKRAAANEAKIIFLPEACDFIAPAASVGSLSRPITPGHNIFFDKVKKTAQTEKIWVNVCVHESSDDPAKCYNTNVVISDTGEVKGVYRKMKLFDVDLAPNGLTMRESDTTIPGKSLSPNVVNTPVGNLGLQTCFDLRFPLLSHQLTMTSKPIAHSLTFPSAFAPQTGAAHWESLLRARAIEGQCYVFASAQIGTHFPGRKSYGHAMIVDPWGTVLAQCAQSYSSAGSLCFAEIDLERVDKIRKEIPMGR